MRRIVIEIMLAVICGAVGTLIGLVLRRAVGSDDQLLNALFLGLGFFIAWKMFHAAKRRFLGRVSQD